MARTIPIDIVQGRIREVEEQQQILATELKVLKDLLGQATEDGGESRRRDAVVMAQGAVIHATGSTPMTQQIIEAVKLNPGIKHSILARQLGTAAAPGSKEKWRVFYNSTYNLIKRGALHKSKSGKLSVPESKNEPNL